jgi:hypothetical protein
LASKYLKKIKYYYNTLTFEYEKLQERQKCLEHKVNEKISNDIHNIQQILDTLTRQSLKTDNREYGNGLQKINQEEEEQPANKDVINIDAEEENISTTIYKMKANWYVSLLMYNSY